MSQLATTDSDKGSTGVVENVLSALGFNRRPSVSQQKPNLAARSSIADEGEPGEETSEREQPKEPAADLFECEDCQKNYTDKLLRAINDGKPWSPSEDELRAIVCLTCTEKLKDDEASENSKSEINRASDSVPGSKNSTDSPGDSFQKQDSEGLEDSGQKTRATRGRRVQRGRRHKPRGKILQEGQDFTQTGDLTGESTPTKEKLSGVASDSTPIKGNKSPPSLTIPASHTVPLQPQLTLSPQWMNHKSHGVSGSYHGRRHAGAAGSVNSVRGRRHRPRQKTSPEKRSELGLPPSPPASSDSEFQLSKDSGSSNSNESSNRGGSSSSSSGSGSGDSDGNNNSNSGAEEDSTLPTTPIVTPSKPSMAAVGVEEHEHELVDGTQLASDSPSSAGASDPQNLQPSGRGLKEKTVRSMVRPYTPTAAKVEINKKQYEENLQISLHYLTLTELCIATQVCWQWVKYIAQQKLKKKCLRRAAVPRWARRHFWHRSAPARPRREQSKYRQLLQLGVTSLLPSPAKVEKMQAGGRAGAGAGAKSVIGKRGENDAKSRYEEGDRNGGDSKDSSENHSDSSSTPNPRRQKSQYSASLQHQEQQHQIREVRQQQRNWNAEITEDVRRTFGPSHNKNNNKNNHNNNSNHAHVTAASVANASSGGNGSEIDGGDSGGGGGSYPRERLPSTCGYIGYAMTDFEDDERSGTSLPAVEVREQRLRNVLLAYAVLNDEVGYCQGMNYLVSLLLSNVGWDEEEAFWLLVLLMEQYEMMHIFRPLRFYQFTALLTKELPVLQAHLQTHGVHPSMFASGWFITLFSNFNTLSPPVVAHIMDVFFMDGWKIIFRVTLAIMALMEHTLLGCTDMECIIREFYCFANDQGRGLDSRVLLRRAMEYKIKETMLQDLAEDYYRQRRMQ